jgi:hypothetical protein
MVRCCTSHVDQRTIRPRAAGMSAPVSNPCERLTETGGSHLGTRERTRRGRMLAYDYPLLDVFFTIVALSFLAIWVFLLVLFIADLFRDRELSGPAKATWLLFLILLPYIGTIAYIVLRGSGLSAREIDRARGRNSAFWSAFDETTGFSGGALA